MKLYANLTDRIPVQLLLSTAVVLKASDTVYSCIKRDWSIKDLDKHDVKALMHIKIAFSLFGAT